MTYITLYMHNMEVYRVFTEEGENEVGEDWNVFQFCWSSGNAGGHIPGRFCCHHEDGDQSKHTPQSRNYTEPAAPSIDIETKGF